MHIVVMTCVSQTLSSPVYSDRKRKLLLLHREEMAQDAVFGEDWL